jgi:hypothetical protein
MQPDVPMPTVKGTLTECPMGVIPTAISKRIPLMPIQRLILGFTLVADLRFA